MTSGQAKFAARLRKFIFNSCPRAGDGTDKITTASSPSWTSPTAYTYETFEELALELFALQFAANSAYRKMCDASGVTPQRVSTWTQILSVPTAAFKEFVMTCLHEADRTRVFHSSGTTGQQPSRHFHSAQSLALYEESLWRWFEVHLATDRDADFQIVCLTPPVEQAPHSSLTHMFDTLSCKLGVGNVAYVGEVADDGSWTLDFNAARDALTRACHSNNSLILLGTAFSFVNLLDSFEQENLSLRLPAGSRVMETGGYKGRSRTIPKAELHALIAQKLGVPPSHIVSEYGMSELSSQAYDLKLDANRDRQRVTRVFHFPPWARVQIISPETGLEVSKGETGLIRVFDLANVWSVLAIQTEDLAIRRGNGFELIGRASLAESRGCSLMAASL